MFKKIYRHRLLSFRPPFARNRLFDFPHLSMSCCRLLPT
nr:MAG TPA: hypothetical protein [Caudoviricetes sp.]